MKEIDEDDYQNIKQQLFETEEQGSTKRKTCYQETELRDYLPTERIRNTIISVSW